MPGTLLFKITQLAVAAAVLLFIPVILYADAAGQWRDGPHVYNKICSYCHDTGIGPEIKGRKLPPEYISIIVRNGYLAMPAFRSAEIDNKALSALSGYISSTPSTGQ